MTRALDKLNELILLSHNDKQIVLGEGIQKPKIMLIGEAPGRDEIIQGRPFVGAAGKQLNALLDFVNIQRSEIYITNVIKFRISKINSQTGREVNRPVTKTELVAEREWLLREIEIVKPALICTLGNSSLRGVTGDFDLIIGKVHGQILLRNINNLDLKIFPLYHPASLIYNRSLQLTFETDLQKLVRRNK